MATLMLEQDLLGRALSTDDPVQLLAQVNETLLEAPNDAIALAAQGVALQRGGDQSNRAAVLSALASAACEASDDLVIWPRIARAVLSIGLTDSFLDELKSRASRPDSTAVHWRVLGKFQFFLDRNDDAVASLIEATTRDGSLAFAWFELARAAVDAQKPDIALDALAQVVRLDPDNESVPVVEAVKIAALGLGGRQMEALDIWRARKLPLAQTEIQRRGIQLAEALLASAHPEEAIEVIDQIEPVIEGPSSRLAALRVKTQALIVAAKYEEALAVLEIADSIVIEKQERTGVRFWQAVALERLGRFDDALGRTDDALSLQPSDSDAGVIHLVRARLFNNKSEYQRALDDLEVIKPELLPEEVRAEFALHRGIALLGLGQNDLALARVDEALARDKNTPLLGSILFWRGSVLIAMKRFEEAQSALAEADRSGFPDSERPSLYYNQALALWGLGRIDGAIEKLDQASELAPNEKFAAALLISKARLLASQEKVEAAFAALDSALKMSPDKTDQGMIHLEKAIIAQSAGPERVSDALTNAEAAVAALGEEEVTKGPRYRALSTSAWALKIQGDYAGALEAIERIAALDPAMNENLPFINARWETLVMLGRYEQALILIKNILDGHSALSGHPLLKVMVAETLRRSGDAGEYFAELAGAVDVPPEHAVDPWAWFGALTARIGTYRLKEAGDAIEHLKVLDEKVFDSPPVRVFRGQVLASMGESRAALELAKDNRDLEGPWRIIAAQTRAQALSETGELDQALVALDQIIDLAAKTPGTDPAVSIFALSMKANCLVRLNQNEAALAALSATDNLTPSPGISDLVEFVTGITGAVVLDRVGRTEQALAKINTAVQAERIVRARFPGGFLEPGRTLWIKGVILFESEREEEALGAFEQAQLAGLPAGETLVWQGRALLALEDPDRALRAFEAALKDAVQRQDIAQQFDALVGKGRALHDAHTYDAAVAAYREALRVGEKDAESSVQYWRRLGESYYALERYGPALRAYRRGWQIKPNAEVARGISAVLIRQKRYGEAHRFFEVEAASLAAQDPPLKYNCALALWGLGKTDRAKRIISEASEAGVVQASEFVNALKPKRDGAGGWWETWFSEEAGKTRFIVGCCLLVAVASAIAAPVFAYFQHTLDWKAALVPAVAGLILLLVPSIKGLSLSTEGVKIDIEPSLLGDGRDVPKPDLLPLGSGFYLFTASLQSLGKPPTDLKRTELDDPNLRLISGGPQMSQMSSPVVSPM